MSKKGDRILSDDEESDIDGRFCSEAVNPFGRKAFDRRSYSCDSTASLF
jgi:hypothetical protein